MYARPDTTQTLRSVKYDHANLFLGAYVNLYIASVKVYMDFRRRETSGGNHGK